MHHRGCEITVARSLRGLVRAQQALGNRENDVSDSRVHEILEKDFLRAFLLMNPRIVGKIIGYSLIAMPQITGAERSIHHFHRRAVTGLRRSVLGRERKRVLNRRHVFLEKSQLLALFLVANHDRGAIRSFHAEQIVQIDFVRREDDVELRVFQIDPGNIARVIVVIEQGLSSQTQEICKSRVLAQCRGLVERSRGRREPGAIGDVIGYGDEAIALALIALVLNHGLRSVERGFLLRMHEHIRFHLFTRQTRRI